ncbi:hypothetical protein B7463_g6146, partial [Scytalidium lignicola]
MGLAGATLAVQSCAGIDDRYSTDGSACQTSNRPQHRRPEGQKAGCGAAETEAVRLEEQQNAVGPPIIIIQWAS